MCLNKNKVVLHECEMNNAKEFVSDYNLVLLSLEMKTQLHLNGDLKQQVLKCSVCEAVNVNVICHCGPGMYMILILNLIDSTVSVISV